MTVKEVKIAMTPAEEKSISRLQTRRKKLPKRMEGGDMQGGHMQGGSVEPFEVQVQAKVHEPPPPMIPKEPVTSGSAIPPPPAATVATPVQTPQTPQSGGSVKIQATKRGHSDAVAKGGVSKILPTKRHMTVKKKHVMKFGGALPTGPAGPNTPPSQPSMSPGGTVSPIPTTPAGPSTPPPSLPTMSPGGTVSPIPTTPAGPNTPPPSQPSMSPGGTVSPIPTTPAGPTSSGVTQTGGLRKTRKFKARKMSITVKNAEATRKHKKSIRRKVKKMDIKDIRKLLLAKGMISAKSNPPEKMLRAMMKEYLLLQSE